MNTVDLRDKVLVAIDNIKLPKYNPESGDKITGKFPIRKGQRFTVMDHGCWDDPKNGIMHDLTLLTDKGKVIHTLFSSKEVDISQNFKLGRKSRK